MIFKDTETTIPEMANKLGLTQRAVEKIYKYLKRKAFWFEKRFENGILAATEGLIKGTLSKMYNPDFLVVDEFMLPLLLLKSCSTFLS